MTPVRQQLHIFILSDMVQIKRGRKSIELMPFDEADALGRDLCPAVAAARATRPIKVVKAQRASGDTSPRRAGSRWGASDVTKAGAAMAPPPVTGESAAAKTFGVHAERAERAEGGGG